jgi:hypothetical protein
MRYVFRSSLLAVLLQLASASSLPAQPPSDMMQCRLSASLETMVRDNERGNAELEAARIVDPQRSRSFYGWERSNA